MIRSNFNIHSTMAAINHSISFHSIDDFINFTFCSEIWKKEFFEMSWTVGKRLWGIGRPENKETSNEYIFRRYHIMVVDRFTTIKSSRAKKSIHGAPNTEQCARSNSFVVREKQHVSSVFHGYSDISFPIFTPLGNNMVLFIRVSLCAPQMN